MIKKDVTALKTILDESFILIHMTGMNQPKVEFLKCIEEGILNYYSAAHKDISINIQGDKVEYLIGKSLVSAAVFGGGRGTWRLKLSIKFVKREDKWLILEIKASIFRNGSRIY